ncbi:MAG: TetR/AcrR family transcriptional regulator, partial [Lachnospiraceae bacterium]
MRTVKEPDVRKQEILDGAIRVFARKGYDKTTIADIAKALNISQGLCYRYYSSKEEIYDAAL